MAPYLALGCTSGAARAHPARILTVLLSVVLGSWLVVPNGVVGAASPTLSLRPATTRPGTVVAVSGVGFAPRQRGDIVVPNATDAPVAFRADRDGRFELDVAVSPTTKPGQYRVSAVRRERGALRRGEPAVVTLADSLLSVLPPISPTASPSAAPSASPTSAPTATAPATPSPVPTVSAAPSPTRSPAPTASPTSSPTGTPSATPSSDIHVYAGQSLQAAIDAAPSGAIIIVHAGSYSPVTARRAVTLREAASERAVISGSGSGSAISISGVANVRIEGLTVQTAQNCINVNRSANAQLIALEVTDCAFGIVFDDGRSGANAGGLVDGAWVHHNDRSIYNAPEPNVGGMGVLVNANTGAVTIRNSTFGTNRAAVPEYGAGGDGAAVEIYEADNVTFTGNTMYDSPNLIETGGAAANCSNNKFTYNTGYTATTAGYTAGILLRCARNSLVAHNTFDGIEIWAAAVTAGGCSGLCSYGTVDGLVVRDNIWAFGPPYYSSSLQGAAVVDYNLRTPGYSKPSSYDTNGVQCDPLFVNRAARDYRLQAGSCAIGRASDGTNIGRY